MQKRPSTQDPDPRETPVDDPRQKSDAPNHKQTDKPWQGTPDSAERLKNDEKSEDFVERWNRKPT